MSSFGHQLILKHKRPWLQGLSDDQTRHKINFDENINLF